MLIVFGALHELWPLIMAGGMLLYVAVLIACAVERVLSRERRMQDLTFTQADFDEGIRRACQNIRILHDLNRVVADNVEGGNELDGGEVNEAIRQLVATGNETTRHLETMRLWAAHDDNEHELDRINRCGHLLNDLYEQIGATRDKHNEMLLLELEANGASREQLAWMRQQSQDMFLMYETSDCSDD